MKPVSSETDTKFSPCLKSLNSAHVLLDSEVLASVDSMNDKRPYLPIELAGKRAPALLDSGANTSCLGSEISQGLDNIVKSNDQMLVANNQSIDISGLAYFGT